MVLKQEAFAKSFSSYAQPLQGLVSSYQPIIDSAVQMQEAYTNAVRPYIQLSPQVENLTNQVNLISKQIEQSVLPSVKILENMKVSLSPLLTSYTQLLDSLQPVLYDLSNESQFSKIFPEINKNSEIYIQFDHYIESKKDLDLPSTDDFLEAEIRDNKIIVGDSHTISNEEIQKLHNEIEDINKYIQSDIKKKQIEEKKTSEKRTIKRNSMIILVVTFFIANEVIIYSGQSGITNPVDFFGIVSFFYEIINLFLIDNDWVI